MHLEKEWYVGVCVGGRESRQEHNSFSKRRQHIPESSPKQEIAQSLTGCEREEKVQGKPHSTILKLYLQLQSGKILPSRYRQIKNWT